MKRGSLFKIIKDEPFRVFFPYGAILAFCGILFWPLQTFKITFQSTSSKFHVWMQMYGFMLAFVIGFLSTAVPKLTRTFSLNGIEITGLLGLHGTGILCLIFGAYKWAHVSFAVLIMFLIAVLSRRFRARKRDVPDTFVFIPFAFLSALLGGILQIAVTFRIPWFVAELYEISKSLIFKSFILFLLLGVGGFLIRSILGWSSAVSPESAVFETQRKIKIVYVTVASTIFLTFLAEPFYQPVFFSGLRALLVSLVVMKLMKVHKKPVSGKMGAWWLSAALWFVIAGLWGEVFWPEHYLGFLHLCFIGGFALSVIVVATRVIFSHCGYEQYLNKTYGPLNVAAALILTGMLTRFACEFLSHSYYRHLAYAGIMWSFGLFVWCLFVIPKLIKNTWLYRQDRM